MMISFIRIKNGENHFLLFSFFPTPNFFPSSSLPASPRPLRRVQGGPVKILKFSTLEDEFLHHLRVFLTSNHTANDDYHLLKLKIKYGESHSLHDPLRGKLAAGDKI